MADSNNPLSFLSIDECEDMLGFAPDAPREKATRKPKRAVEGTGRNTTRSLKESAPIDGFAFCTRIPSLAQAYERKKEEYKYMKGKSQSTSLDQAEVNDSVGFWSDGDTSTKSSDGLDEKVISDSDESKIVKESVVPVSPPVKANRWNKSRKPLHVPQPAPASLPEDAPSDVAEETAKLAQDLTKEERLQKLEHSAAYGCKVPACKVVEGPAPEPQTEGHRYYDQQGRLQVVQVNKEGKELNGGWASSVGEVKDYEDKIKAVALREQGLSKKEVADKLERSERWVQQWWKCNPAILEKPAGAGHRVLKVANENMHRDCEIMRDCGVDESLYDKLYNGLEWTKGKVLQRHRDTGELTLRFDSKGNALDAQRWVAHYVGGVPEMDKQLQKLISELDIRDNKARIIVNYYADGNASLWAHRHDHWSVLLSLGQPRVLTIDNQPVVMRNNDAIVIGTQMHGVPVMPDCSGGRISVNLFFRPDADNLERYRFLSVMDKTKRNEDEDDEERCCEAVEWVLDAQKNTKPGWRTTHELELHFNTGEIPECTVYSVGVGFLSEKDFFELLKGEGITSVVDLRTPEAANRCSEYLDPEALRRLCKLRFLKFRRDPIGKRDAGGVEKHIVSDEGRFILWRMCAAAAAGEKVCFVGTKTSWKDDVLRSSIGDILTSHGVTVMHCQKGPAEPHVMSQKGMQQTNIPKALHPSAEGGRAQNEPVCTPCDESVEDEVEKPTIVDGVLKRPRNHPSYILKHYHSTGCSGGAFSWRAAMLNPCKEMYTCWDRREFRPTNAADIQLSLDDKRRGGGPRVGGFQETIPGEYWEALPKYDLTTNCRSTGYNERMHVEWECHADHILENGGDLPVASVVAKAGFRSCAPCCRDMLALARPTGKTFIMVDLAEQDDRGTFHFVTGAKYTPIAKESCTPQQLNALKTIVSDAQDNRYASSEAIDEAVQQVGCQVDEVAQNLYYSDHALLPPNCAKGVKGQALMDVLHAEHFARLTAEYGASILRDRTRPQNIIDNIKACREKARAKLLEAWRRAFKDNAQKYNLEAYAAAAAMPLLPEKPEVYERLRKSVGSRRSAGEHLSSNTVSKKDRRKWNVSGPKGQQAKLTADRLQAIDEDAVEQEQGVEVGTSPYDFVKPGFDFDAQSSAGASTALPSDGTESIASGPSSIWSDDDELGGGSDREDPDDDAFEAPPSAAPEPALLEPKPAPKLIPETNPASKEIGYSAPLGAPIAHGFNPKPRKEVATPFNEIDIYHGQVIVDRKSEFQAHVARVSSAAQVTWVLEKLLEDKQLALGTATHNVTAYRYRSAAGGLICGDDDDGEANAGSKLAKLLDLRQEENIFIMVSRWRGPVQLGLDRFKHYSRAAQALLDEAFGSFGNSNDKRGRSGSAGRRKKSPFRR